MKKRVLMMLACLLLLTACSTTPAETGSGQRTEAPPVTRETESTAPDTKDPESTAPDTKAPESTAPDTKAPETKAPETAPPDPQPSESAAPGPLRFTKESYPRVDGATGMYPMSLEIAKALIGLSEEEAEE
ncbi:MAG: hypothetical protein J6H18_00225, partial [Lachnospiraceae bacterium]|nr:hypothetical protein [Lachnospiraceae bacterium]